MFDVEMNGPAVVAEDCKHFPQLLVWERKKKLKLELKLGKELKKNHTQIWPYLCEILFNSFPNLPPLRDRDVY